MFDIKQVADWVCNDCGDFRFNDWFIIQYNKCGYCIDEIKKFKKHENN